MKATIPGHIHGEKAAEAFRGVTLRCDCGFLIRYQDENLGCIECGQPCRPACVFLSEGAVYCGTCARKLYGLASRVNVHEGRGLTYFIDGSE